MIRRSLRTCQGLRGNIAWLLHEQWELGKRDADYTALVEKVKTVYAQHRGAGAGAGAVAGADANVRKRSRSRK